MKHLIEILALALALPALVGASVPEISNIHGNVNQTFIAKKSTKSSVTLLNVQRYQLLSDDVLLNPVLKKESEKADSKELMQHFGIRFQENKGQIADMKGKVRKDILFTAESGGARLFFRGDGISYVFQQRENAQMKNKRAFDPMVVSGRNPIEGLHELPLQKVSLYRMDMNLLGANKTLKVRMEDPEDGMLNFYLAHCPDGITGVKEYRKIVYENVYPNVDMEYYSVDGRMKYNFIVRPGGRVEDIRMKYDGASSIDVNNNGMMKITTPLGLIEEAQPYSYQITSGINTCNAIQSKVQSSFEMKDNVVSFRVAGRDPSKTLVIDPWATYYGGSFEDSGQKVSTDVEGNVVITGNTNSTDFPVLNAQQSSISSSYSDVFVVKFTSNGERLWATYYGGSDHEMAYGISTDDNNNVYISGTTYSTNFPTQNAQQSWFGGGSFDAFVVKFNATGTRQWATYCGGNNSDWEYGISTDSDGNVYIAGETSSVNFPVQNAFQSIKAGQSDAYIVKYNTNGVRQWSTFYGGSSFDCGRGICTDVDGNVVITGYTYSTNFPVLNAQQSYNAGGYDAFVVKLNTNGQRQWTTYYGGSSHDYARDVATDSDGDVVIVGDTYCTDFPVFNAYQTSIAGNKDAFIVKFNSSGFREWATYYGGSDLDAPYGIAVDYSDNIVFSGVTWSTNIPILNAFQSSKNGTTDAFVAKFGLSGILDWATYYGGSDDDGAVGIAVNGAGDVIITGRTASTDLFVINSFQSSNASVSPYYNDVFVTQFTPTGTLETCISPSIVCPSDIIITTDQDQCAALINIIATATGVPTPTVSYFIDSNPIISPHIFPLGTTSVTANATNSCGTTSCAFTIQVSDRKPPTVITKNVTVHLNGIGNASVTVSQIDDGSSDGCGIATMTVSPNTFNCSNIGTNTVTLTATDVNGNSNSATALVTIDDITPPVITVQSTPISHPSMPNKYEEYTVWDLVTSVTDNCTTNPDLSVVWVTSDEPDDCGPKVNDVIIATDCKSVRLRKERCDAGNGRVYNVRLKATDESGNTSYATRLVTIPKGNQTPIDDYPTTGYMMTSSCYPKMMTETHAIPSTISLSQNFPNPFNPTTSITYGIPEEGHVLLKVFDVHGRIVSELVNEAKEAGTYTVEFDGSNLPSGVYLYRLEANGQLRINTMTLVK